MISSDEGLLLQLAAFAGNEPKGSYLEIRSLHQSGKPGPREFLPVCGLREIITRIKTLPNVNVYVGAVPRVRKNGRAEDVERQWTLWADCDSENAVKRLRAFKPRPAIVAKTSPGRMQGLWPLKEAVDPLWGRKANRRLAYHLSSDMAATDPARILRAIGTRNHKHRPPAVVTCARAEPEVFDIRAVVSHLSDAPVPERKPYTGPPSSPKTTEGLVRVIGEVPVGERNHALFWAACKDHEQGCNASEQLYRAGIDAGLPDFEVRRTLDSAARCILGK